MGQTGTEGGEVGRGGGGPALTTSCDEKQEDTFLQSCWATRRIPFCGKKMHFGKFGDSTLLTMDLLRFVHCVQLAHVNLRHSDTAFHVVAVQLWDSMNFSSQHVICHAMLRKMRILNNQI